jgi:hypothetical protein
VAKAKPIIPELETTGKFGTTGCIKEAHGYSEELAKNVIEHFKAKWEILMLRNQKSRTDSTAFKAGLNNECDPVAGIYNAGLQWIGSGAVEWLAVLLYQSDGNRRSVYMQMK